MLKNIKLITLVAFLVHLVFCPSVLATELNKECDITDNILPDHTMNEFLWLGLCLQGKVNGFGELLFEDSDQIKRKAVGNIEQGSFKGTTKIYIFRSNKWELEELIFFDGNRSKDSSYVQINDSECLFKVPGWENSITYDIETDIPCKYGLLHGEGYILIGPSNEATYILTGKVLYGSLQGFIDKTEVGLIEGSVLLYQNSEVVKKMGSYGVVCEIKGMFGCMMHKDLETGENVVPYGQMSLGQLYDKFKSAGEKIGKATHTLSRQMNLAICGNPDYCPSQKIHNQNQNISSNVDASNASLGSKSSVCFYINNTWELDLDSRLTLSKENESSIALDTKGLFGSNCIYGKNLGGKYKYNYSTKNRTRAGELYITGDYNYVLLELSSKFIPNDKAFSVLINERNEL